MMIIDVILRVVILEIGNQLSQMITTAYYLMELDVLTLNNIKMQDMEVLIKYIKLNIIAKQFVFQNVIQQINFSIILNNTV